LRKQPGYPVPPTFRFAPSPNGDLHLGHALSAITGFEMAKAVNGRFLLRMEDIDITRTREAHVVQILDDLAWIGLTWETPVMRQSARFDVYRDAANRLLDQGLLYPCWATRSELAAAAAQQPIGLDPDGAPLYPGLHKNLTREERAIRQASGEPFALRLDMEKAISLAARLTGGAPLTFKEIGQDGRPSVVQSAPERWGDAVVVRKEFPASYHLAVVVDDAAQGVTHVTRGRDLYDATGLQRLLQVLLGLPEPVYHHHRLILGPDGTKLSKSAGDTSLRDLRAKGATQAEIRRLVGL
jgi:glutamyl-Q tRNA(Asp) synthetase